MGTVLNDTAFSQLIDENIEWLMEQDTTSLERGHTVECLKWLRREREAGNLADRAGEVCRADLKTELARAKKVLRKYGGHDLNCALLHKEVCGYDSKCNCGWTEAKAATLTGRER